MKKKCISNIILLFFIKISCAQHTPQNWIIGGGTGNPFNNQQISFASPTTVQSLPGLNNPFHITNASIGDANGNLLYYTNGLNIYYKYNNVIKDGDSINPSIWYSSWNNNGMPLPQMAVFIPSPSDSNRFYLFHASVDINYQPCLTLGGGDLPNKLYYSLIDKTLDNGNGGVVSKNNIISSLGDSLGQSILAIKHGNGRDWWIILRHATQASWLSWLVTPTGIAGPFYQSIGSIACAGYWNLKFSSLTSKIAGFRCYFIWPHTRYIDLYDFDRCTGLFSNPQTLQMTNIAKYMFPGGCEFSPSGRYLYGSAINKLYQFDMLAANIQTSKVVVDSVDSLDFGNYKMWGVSQLAPDGKIYSKIPNAIPFLSVINYPDSAGLACNAVHGGIALPNFHYGDLPNIPLYELGPLVGSGCDTITGSPPVPKGGATGLKIYPNPVLNKLTASPPTSLHGRGEVTLTIYDMLGKVQLQQKVLPQVHFNVDVKGLSSGLYLLQLKQGDRLFYGRFVKE